MSLRIRSVVQAFVVLAFFAAAFPSTLVAQDDDEEARRKAEEQKLEEQQRAEQEAASQKVKETREKFVNEERATAENTVESSRRPSTSIDRQFVDAVPAYRKAVSDFRDAAGSGSSLDKPLKDLDKAIVAFKNYFREAHISGEIPDRGQFNKLSKQELRSETLHSAADIETKLQKAGTLIEESERSNSLSVDSMVFLRNLHSDFLRLDLLRNKVK